MTNQHSPMALSDIQLHRGDLPDDLALGPVLAVDTETTGLNPFRDRLCVVQLSDGNGVAHLVQFPPGEMAAAAPNLVQVLADPQRLKIFHFARFDLAILHRRLGVLPQPVYCTKVASKLVRTYTDKHGLKELCREVLGVEVSKQQQSSDWGAAELTNDQLSYAAQDVAYLHALKDRLDAMLLRERRAELASACFAFLPARALLDLGGWDNPDLFQH